jgi:hypothetical protein
MATARVLGVSVTLQAAWVQRARRTACGDLTKVSKANARRSDDQMGHGKGPEHSTRLSTRARGVAFSPPNGPIHMFPQTGLMPALTTGP